VTAMEGSGGGRGRPAPRGGRPALLRARKRLPIVTVRRQPVDHSRGRLAYVACIWDDCESCHGDVRNVASAKLLRHRESLPGSRESGVSVVIVGGARGAGRIEAFGRSGRVVGSGRVRGFRDSVTGCDGANVCFAPISSLSADVAPPVNHDRQGPRDVLPRRSRDFYPGWVWTPRPDTDKLAYRYDGRIRGSGT
jgi:hypothetical protein